MIGLLRGVVVTEEATGHVLLDVAGVGYELAAPIGTIGRAQTDAEGRTTLYVHTHVRQEALDLFGFASVKERAAFRLLIGIPNVGPKTAVNVLSSLPISDLAQAVKDGNVARLGKVPGIGKKTAERLALELKDKLWTAIPQEQRKQGDRGRNAERLVAALTNMGYRPAEAEHALKAIDASPDDMPLEQLLKKALAVLTR